MLSPFKVLDKSHFCLSEKPYTMDPQKMGEGQSLTASPMQVTALDAIAKALEGRREARVLDLGCGFGFSTLMIAILM